MQQQTSDVFFNAEFNNKIIWIRSLDRRFFCFLKRRLFLFASYAVHCLRKQFQDPQRGSATVANRSQPAICRKA